MKPDDLSQFLATFGSLAEAATQYAHQAKRGDRQLLTEYLSDFLGTDATAVPVNLESISPFRVVDADVALEYVVQAHGGGELFGVSGGESRWHTSLSEMLNPGPFGAEFTVGPVDYKSAPISASADRSIVAFGGYLFTYTYDGVPHRAAVLNRSARPGFGEGPMVEVLIADDAAAAAFLAELRAAMNSQSVLRGQVVTFVNSEFEASLGNPTQGAVTFHDRPEMAEEEIILPEGTLQKISRHVIGIGSRREALLAAGQHLKRGVLLYGPPGTGKTHTVRYLISQAQDTTVILLSGMALNLVGLAAQTARALAPAMVVLEDCDLVAEERGMYGSSPLLFEVLDALDGLASDADVAFVLTTNRAEVLEPALAQRPGRVDLAVEIPKPDLAARRELLELYAGKLGFSGAVLDEVAAATEGVTASFTKELVRRSVLIATEGEHPVGDADLREAVTEMTSDESQISQALFGGVDVDSLGGYA